MALLSMRNLDYGRRVGQGFTLMLFVHSSVAERSSVRAGELLFRPAGACLFPLSPRLTPWAAFLRRFAARNAEICSTASAKF